LRSCCIDALHPITLNDHIIVCIGQNWDCVLSFLCTLRSAHLYTESFEYKPVLFLSTSLPSQDLFSTVNIFPGIYFMAVSDLLLSLLYLISK
jgi:hypothetical protein